MRNMSFSATTEQVRNGTKTVTRRLGWKFLKPGDTIMACVKCQGLKKGEKVEKIRPLKIVNVDLQQLLTITKEEVKREGFPGRNPEWFTQMFCQLNQCSPYVLLTRIEFEYIPD